MESPWDFPGNDPGKSPHSRLGSQSSASSEASRPGLGLKKGSNMRYAVESLRKGTTRRVPSVAFVAESEVQPCQVRKTVHWFLCGHKRLCTRKERQPTVNHRYLGSQLTWGSRRRSRAGSMNRLLRIYGHSRTDIRDPPSVRDSLHQYVVRGTSQQDLAPESSTCRNKR